MNTGTLSQDLLVLQDGTTYKAITDFTHEVICQSKAAHEAIQSAIDILGVDGGEVRLGRGRFRLDEPVHLADNVWLRGAGRGSKLQINTEIGLMCTGIKGAVLSDLALTAQDKQAAKTGIVVDDCGDCKVRDVFCTGFGQYGIWVRNNAFLCEIRGCSLAGNEVANLYLDHLARGRYGDFLPNLVTNCITYGGGKGIECNRTIVLNIVACAVYQCRDIAYYVGNTSNSVLISGCRSFQIGSHAVVADHSHEFNLSSNIFCWHQGHGVLIRDCNWGTITGNEVIDTGSYNPGGKDHVTKFSELPEKLPLYNGIELSHAQGFSVTGNTIFNWGVCPRLKYGIREDKASFKNVVTGNNVNYYEGADLHCQGQGTVVRGNVGHKDKPYQSGETAGTVVQSFETELTEQFIAEQT